MQQLETEEKELSFEQYRQSSQKETTNLKQQLVQLEGQLKNQEDEYNNKLTQLRGDNDARCKELIDQRDQHKQTAKDLKEANAELTKSIEEINVSLEQAQAGSKKHEDELFWQLVQQVSLLKEVISNKDKDLQAQKDEFIEARSFQSKNTQDLDKVRAMYNDQIDELEKEKETLYETQTKLHEEIATLTEKLESATKDVSELQN